MVRGALVLMALLPACGRMGFENRVHDGAADNVLADVPPLPATHVCAATRQSIGALSAAADLAVAASGAGATALWVDATGTLRGFVGDALNPGGAEMIIQLDGAIDGVAGLVTTPMTTLFVTHAGTMQTLWKLSGATATELRTEATVAGREPFMNDATGIPRTWIRGEAAGLRASYVDDSGVLKPDIVFPTSGPVIALSAADNDDHGHVTWSLGGPGSCEQSDIDFPNGTNPVFGSSGGVGADCVLPRIASGPGPTDSIATVWRSTSTGSIEMRFRGGTVDDNTQLSTRGRAPKIRFDGIDFWVAWIDEPPTGDVLRVARVAQDLTFTAVDLAGWNPVGNEAFELVRTSDGEIRLALLSANSLSFLRACP
jgi:hypothetical protein